MKRLAILLPLALAGCDALSGDEPAARIDLEEVAASTPSPDPEAADNALQGACAPLEFEGQTFTHCIASPARHAITTALAPEGRPPFRSFAGFRADHGADGIAFAMNGGMFDDAGQPIGYYVEGGQRLHEINRADGPGNFHLKPNGVFFGDTNGNWRVLSTEAFVATVRQRPAFGTQSGPMLVVDGEIHPGIAEDGPSRNTRNAVGVDGEGMAHFVISQGDISFGVIARLFRDELQTPNALYLDGTVSSLWDPATERMDGLAPLGPLIVVSNRATEAP